MMTIAQARVASFEELTDELAAGGWQSDGYESADDAREACIRMLMEYGNVIETEDKERKLTEIKVYWDSQDPNNEGWAYKAYYSDEHEESGSLELVDPDDLDNAIMEACSMLGVDLTHDDFAKSNEEGGVADWRLQ